MGSLVKGFPSRTQQCSYIRLLRTARLATRYVVSRSTERKSPCHRPPSIGQPIKLSIPTNFWGHSRESTTQLKGSRRLISGRRARLSPPLQTSSSPQIRSSNPNFDQNGALRVLHKRSALLPLPLYTVTDSRNVPARCIALTPQTAMIPSHLLAGPSSGSSARRSSLSPPGSAHLPRRGSSLRQTSSACDLMDDQEEEDDEDEHHHPASSSGRAWRPAASPTTSESDDDACDFQDHFPSPPSTSSSSSSLSILDEHAHASAQAEAEAEERQSRSTSISGTSRMPPSPKSRTCLAIPPPASTLQSHKRPRGLVPLSTISSTSGVSNSHGSTGSNNSSGALSLPKAQPLARTLFARMADTPHAGTGLGLLGGSGNKKGGKAKLIVATKPMRTTFELGLTSSELARRA